MSGYEIIWNGISSQTIPEFVCENVDRDMLGEHTGVFIHIPGRSGAWYFPDERGQRAVVAHCYVLAPTFPQSRRSLLTQVAEWLDINGETTLAFSDDPDVFYQAVLVDAPSLKEWRNLGKFDLVWSIQPWAYDTDPTVVTFDQSSDDEWDYNFDVGVATYPIVEITNTGGDSISGVFFTMNNDTLNFQGAIPPAGTITINSIGMAVTEGANDDTMLTGVYEPTETLMTLVEGTFPVIIPGTNSMEINTEDPSATLEIRVTYRKRYRN